jgi:hypothetical protein
MPATLTTAPLGASDPRRTAMPPVGVDGVGQRMDHAPVGGGGEGGQVLGHRPPGHREAVAVEQTGVEQLGHDHRHPADRSRSTMW